MRSRKALTFFTLALGLVFALSAWAQQKPLTEDQVQSLVRSGLGDETGAKAIEQRGIDFAPAEDFLQSLKAAGASEVFLKALRAAKAPEPASPKKPLNQVQVFALLAGQVPSHRVTMLVEERGIDFEPTNDYLQEVRLAGGEDELITALKGAKVTKPATVDLGEQARQAQLQQHVAHGAELAKKTQYAEAEQEYRAALLLDSQNADLYVNLAYVLSMQHKWDDSATAAREALHLNPNNEIAHVNLGVALENKNDFDGAMAEYREALRLNPNNDMAHASLGFALRNKKDFDGAMAEYREALRLNPNNDLAHVYLGAALVDRDDAQGAESEFREALRLNPKSARAHVGLGAILELKNDRHGAQEEYRTAYMLDPENPLYKKAYEQGTLLGPETEHPQSSAGNDADAHFNLGTELAKKGDLDGAIAEYREALRLNPNDAKMHAILAGTLDLNGDKRGAMEEFRAASILDPRNARYKLLYRHLLQQVNQSR
jgi:tetratricopeptide (TPR) repeat protein